MDIYCWFRWTVNSYDVFITNQNIREGDGTPLQYSCLENPMGGGAWRAAAHGVAEGRTRLKRLSSSSSSSSHGIRVLLTQGENGVSVEAKPAGTGLGARISLTSEREKRKTLLQPAPSSVKEPAICASLRCTRRPLRSPTSWNLNSTDVWVSMRFHFWRRNGSRFIMSPLFKA